jgi:hypothetical protein
LEEACSWESARPDHLPYRRSEQDLPEAGEVGGVARVERKAVGYRGRSDQQVGEAGTRRPARRLRRDEDPALRARLPPERQRIPGCRRPLQPVLAPRPLLLVSGGMRPGASSASVTAEIADSSGGAQGRSAGSTSDPAHRSGPVGAGARPASPRAGRRRPDSS